MRIRRLSALLAATTALAATAAHAQPPVAQPLAVRHSADEKFAGVEHEYVTYVLGQFPVVATYLGGSAFDPSLRGIDGRLRDYSPAAMQKEDAQLAEFRARFAALAPAGLSARRRIDRSVALAEIAFLEHEHQVRRICSSSLDSYVDEPRRGVDWQIQGMTATGAARPTGRMPSGRRSSTRTRASPGLPCGGAAAAARRARGAHVPPTGACCSTSGCRARRPTRTISRTAPAARRRRRRRRAREALLRELQRGGRGRGGRLPAAARFVAEAFFEGVTGRGSPHSRLPTAPIASPSARPSTTGRCATTCA